MILPLEWLKEYVKTDKSPEEIAQSFTQIGLMQDRPSNGVILDLEHRMDRSDWLSIMGCARDFAAYERLELKIPQLYTEKGKEGGGVEIKVECPEIIRRFNTRVFKNIKVAESPEWLKKRLTDYGMTPINNIVDITNYVMVEMGNPMHAQDLSKFQKQEIVLRRAQEGETITTLDGSIIKMDSSMFVLAQNGEPIVLGGIVGGQKTGVTPQTTEIVLDAGNYDQAVVRKAARKLGIYNETVSRYDKYLHPKLTEIAIERATQLILEIAGGEYYENEDYYPNPIPQKEMTVRKSRLELLSGMSFDMEVAKDVLLRLGYEILEENPEQISVKVPYFRTDVEVEDDLVADILRIFGYSKIPTRLTESAPPQEITPSNIKFEAKLKEELARLGLHEHITDPLVPASPTIEDQVILENSQSSEKNALRTNLYETLYPVVENYKKHGISDIRVFEIGKVFTVNGPKSDLKSYSEKRILQIIIESNEEPYKNALETKEIYSTLLHVLGISDYTLGTLTYNSISIDMEKIENATKKNLKVVDEYINKITEDISITLPIKTAFGPYMEKILNNEPRLLNAYLVEEYFNPEKTKRSVLIRMEFADKSITKKETSELKEKLLKELAL